MKKIFAILGIVIMGLSSVGFSASASSYFIEDNPDGTFTQQSRYYGDWYSGRHRNYDGRINVGTTNNQDTIAKGRFILAGETGYYSTKNYSLDYRQASNYYKSGMSIGRKYWGTVDTYAKYNHSPWYNA